MPNGSLGDNPLTDLFTYGEHPFPPDMEQMLRRIHTLAPLLVRRLRSEPFDWECGRSLGEGRDLLKRLLDEAEARHIEANDPEASIVRPTYRLDGAAFSNLEGFYDEVESRLLGGIPWGRSLDALNDILRGEFGALPREFTVVWEHSDLSRERLSGTGRGSFAELLEIFAENPNVELVLS
jgi:RNAse (barnase) inhibitor barstar